MFYVALVVGSSALLISGAGAVRAQTAPLPIVQAAWRHVPSPDPRGGAEGEALLQTADLDSSDVGLVGLMIRCHDKQLEPVVVLLEPVPPGTSARVTITLGGRRDVYAATAIPTGAGLSLPVDVSKQIGLQVSGGGTLGAETDVRGANIKGQISLEGLAEPMSSLERRCTQTP